jgi:hypothetical protein
MFVLSEAGASSIRAAFDRGGEFWAAVHPRARYRAARSRAAPVYRCNGLREICPASNCPAIVPDLSRAASRFRHGPVPPARGERVEETLKTRGDRPCSFRVGSVGLSCSF